MNIYPLQTFEILVDWLKKNLCLFKNENTM